MPTNVRDPRTIITPDAFEIDRALLGLPLAPPWRRFWALALDLAVVGVLTAVLSSVQLLLWTVIGLVLLRLALKRSGRSMSQAAGVVLRVAVGCLGVSILGVVVLAYGFMRMAGDPEEAVQRAVTAGMDRAVGERLVRAAQEGDTEVLRELSDVDLSGAGDADAALVMFEDALEGLERAPFSDDVKRQILMASVPPGASWSSDADSLVAVAMARAREEGEPDPDPFADAPEEDPPVAAEPAGADEVAVEDMDPEAVLREFAALVEADADGTAPRYRALRTRLAVLVAADTLEELSDEVADLREQLEEEREARRSMASDFEEERSGAAAFAGLVRDIWDQLGSAIGLWSIYFTVLTTLLNGRTVGKRLMGVRVVRLDGAPIGWWPAFERAGGYVAGLATGLLGFAQVFWDPNRQCIHDKIVGTVVVDERAERVPGAWEEAWAAGPGTPEGTMET